jgi:hypothetical protein
MRRTGPGWLGLPTDRHELRRRAIRDGLVVAGSMTSIFILVVIPAVGRSLGYDAYSYWFDDLAERYSIASRGIYELGAFRYAPPIGALFSWFVLLPWWLYLWLWSALLVGTVIWIGGRATPYLLALPPVALELYHGNVHLLMAVAIVLGFRHPAAWSFVLLTKVTPGIGLLWFAVRREWRPLLIAIGATVAIVAVSYVATPMLWGDWLQTLELSASRPADLSIPPPLIVRLPAAALLVIWGARTDRAWSVGIAAMLALPNLWPHGLAVGIAAVPFLRRRAPADVLAHHSARSLIRTVGITLALALLLAVLLPGPLERLVSAASAAVMRAAGLPAPGG